MKRFFPTEIRKFGPNALLIEWKYLEKPEVISREIHSLFSALRMNFPELEITPGINSLVVRISNPEYLPENLQDYLELFNQQYPLLTSISNTNHQIPVCFDEPYSPDLESVAQNIGCTQNDLIDRIIKCQFTVLMIGFLPGFPYMSGWPDKWQIARKVKPTGVMAGSVGIAGFYMGIYPVNSPGGWHILGRTPFRIFNPDSVDLPCLLNPLDMVTFYAINKTEFDVILNQPVQ